MNRRNRILAGIRKHDLGVEIAPWFNPLATKREGFNIRTLDVFDFDTLMERAKQDPNIPEATYGNLSEVDYVGCACDIAQIVPQADHATFDYIISSHNFEHLPDPIKFLQGCEALLKLGGLLSMAVPDVRGCFDYFRPWTVTADWIEAFLESREKPNERSVFSHVAAHAPVVLPDGAKQATFPFDQPIESIGASEKYNLLAILKDRLAHWQAKADADYIDCHCTVMTPSSLELLLLDCQMLGLTQLKVESIESSGGYEIYVRLRKTASPCILDVDGFTARRNALMRQTLIERKKAINDAASAAGTQSETPLARVRTKLVGTIRSWNRARIKRRRDRRRG